MIPAFHIIFTLISFWVIPPVSYKLIDLEESLATLKVK
jgi:hypothetical protein